MFSLKILLSSCIQQTKMLWLPEVIPLAAARLASQAALCCPAASLPHLQEVCYVLKILHFNMK